MCSRITKRLRGAVIPVAMFVFQRCSTGLPPLSTGFPCFCLEYACGVTLIHLRPNDVIFLARGSGPGMGGRSALTAYVTR